MREGEGYTDLDRDMSRREIGLKIFTGKEKNRGGEDQSEASYMRLGV